MNGYAASVDWPAAAFWHELADSFPDAIVLPSTRSSAEVWWKSANETIFDINRTLSQDPALVDFEMDLDMVKTPSGRIALTEGDMRKGGAR